MSSALFLNYEAFRTVGTRIIQDYESKISKYDIKDFPLLFILDNHILIFRFSLTKTHLRKIIIEEHKKVFGEW